MLLNNALIFFMNSAQHIGVLLKSALWLEDIIALVARLQVDGGLLLYLLLGVENMACVLPNLVLEHEAFLSCSS